MVARASDAAPSIYGPTVWYSLKNNDTGRPVVLTACTGGSSSIATQVYTMDASSNRSDESLADIEPFVALGSKPNSSRASSCAETTIVASPSETTLVAVSWDPFPGQDANRTAEETAQVSIFTPPLICDDDSLTTALLVGGSVTASSTAHQTQRVAMTCNHPTNNNYNKRLTIGPVAWFVFQGTGDQVAAIVRPANASLVAVAAMFLGNCSSSGENNGLPECATMPPTATFFGAAETSTEANATYYLSVQLFVRDEKFDVGTGRHKGKARSEPFQVALVNPFVGCENAHQRGRALPVDGSLAAGTTQADRTILGPLGSFDWFYPAAWFRFQGTGTEVRIQALPANQINTVNETQEMGFQVLTGDCRTKKLKLRTYARSITMFTEPDTTYYIVLGGTKFSRRKNQKTSQETMDYTIGLMDYYSACSTAKSIRANGKIYRGRIDPMKSVPNVWYRAPNQGQKKPWYRFPTPESKNDGKFVVGYWFEGKRGKSVGSLLRAFPCQRGYNNMKEDQAKFIDVGGMPHDGNYEAYDYAIRLFRPSSLCKFPSNFFPLGIGKHDITNKIVSASPFEVDRACEKNGMNSEPFHQTVNFWFLGNGAAMSVEVCYDSPNFNDFNVFGREQPVARLTVYTGCCPSVGKSDCEWGSHVDSDCHTEQVEGSALGRTSCRSIYFSRTKGGELYHVRVSRRVVEMASSGGLRPKKDFSLTLAVRSDTPSWQTLLLPKVLLVVTINVALTFLACTYRGRRMCGHVRVMCQTFDLRVTCQAFADRLSKTNSAPRLESMDDESSEIETLVASLPPGTIVWMRSKKKNSAALTMNNTATEEPDSATEEKKPAPSSMNTTEPERETEALIPQLESMDKES